MPKLAPTTICGTFLEALRLDAPSTLTDVGLILPSGPIAARKAQSLARDLYMIVAQLGMSFVVDLLQSGQRSSQELELDSWPVAFQPSERDIEQSYERYMELGASISGSCPADFAKGDLHTASSLSSDRGVSEAQTRSRSNDLGMSEPAKRLSAAERKLQSNRQAQKRFRQRQKVCLWLNVLCENHSLLAAEPPLPRRKGHILQKPNY